MNSRFSNLHACFCYFALVPCIFSYFLVVFSLSNLSGGDVAGKAVGNVESINDQPRFSQSGILFKDGAY